MNTTSPQVSVCMITYNHEEYISDAIKGFLIQKTNFEIELVIGDDCSTDNTRKICEEFAQKYSNINLLPSDKNLGMMPNFQRTLKACTGKYIALCEGDDYWTDPLKLQKQVDFLEANPEYSMCFHNAMIVYDGIKNKSHLFSKMQKNEFDIIDVIKMPWFVPTQSMVFRNGLYESPEWVNYVISGDYALQLVLATKGKFWRMNETMSVYQKNKGGVSSNQPVNYTALNKIENLTFFNMYTNFQYHTIIQDRIKEIHKSLYINYVYSRPFFSRVLSLDFLLFKIKNFIKRFKSN